MRCELEITRSQRTERPSIQQIYADSVALVEGRIGDISQDPSADNYFIFSGDPSLELIRIEATKAFHNFGNGAGDGMRVLKYPFDGGTGRLTPLPDETFEVHSILENDGSSIDAFNDLGSAFSHIASLNASDGYYLVGESDKSEVMASRPSLHKLTNSEGEESLLKVKNLHQRTDTDRY